MIQNITVEILGDTYQLDRSQIISANLSLGADDRSSTVTVELADPDLSIADKLATHSRQNVGIKLPPEFGASSTSSIEDPGSNINSGSGDNIENTENLGGKLPGLENEPLSISAFCTAIYWCEYKTNYPNPPVYNVRFGGFRFSGYSDHPRIKHTSGSLTSDAAGAPQYLSSTWDEVRRAIGATDFSPKWQNKGCVWLLKNRSQNSSTYSLAAKGDDASALRAAKGCANTWASLPGSPYGQPTVTDNEFIKFYNRAKNTAATAVFLPLDNLFDWNIIDSFNPNTQVRIDLTKHGTREYVYNAVNYLNDISVISGNFGLMMSEGLLLPYWVSDDLSTREKYQHEAILYDAGLYGNQGIKRINGFNNSEEYVIPDYTLSPNYPGFTAVATSTEESDNEGVETPSDINVGERLYLTVKTETQEYKYSFIYSNVSINPLDKTINITARAIKASLDYDRNDSNLENVTPSEAVQITANKYDIKTRLGHTEKPILNRLESNNQTSLEFILDTSVKYGITAKDNPLTDELEITDSEEFLVTKNIILSNIISVQFNDDGVIDEKPLYPVSLTAISENLLEVLPRDSIDLSSIYNFIPDSLKNDVWLVNTINHDLISQQSTLDLLKYIPENTSASGSGSSSTYTESQLLTKYQDAVTIMGSASGFFVTSDGYLLTAEHLAGKEDRTIKTILRDSSTFDAQIIDRDYINDVMLCKIDKTGCPITPIAPDDSIYPSDTEPITKIGHGWTSEIGGGYVPGGFEQKDWDVTTSTVMEFKDVPYWRPGSDKILADDITVDFINPGDSGCPWLDKWGNVVSLSSAVFGRSHSQGAGKGREAIGPRTSAILAMLNKHRIAYKKGSRAAEIPLESDTTSNGISSSLVESMRQLGKFSTSSFYDPNLACAWSVNKIIKNAGLKQLGQIEERVSSLRIELMNGRGKKLNKSEVNGGDIVIARGCHHIGICLNSSRVRSSSSSRERFDWESDLTFGGYYASKSDMGLNTTTEYWRLLS